MRSDLVILGGPSLQLLSMRTRLLILIACLATAYCFSQEDIFPKKSTLNKSHCATGPLLYDNEKDILHDNRYQVNKNSGYSHWPMNIHIVTKTDGTGGISLEDVTKGIANLNYVYDDINLEYFISSVNYINSDLYYDFVDTLTYEQDLLDAHFVGDAINVFFFNSIRIPNFGYACGYAYYPGNWQYSATMMMDNQCTATAANGTFAHELGHHLNLPHTFNGTSNGHSHSNAEHVPRSGANSNCSTHGDYQCDTDADPQANYTEISNCVYTGADTDIHGNVYNPPIDNIMSYYSDNCGGILSPGQYNRCNNAMTTRLGHSAYDIDGAAPMVVNNPSGLTLTINGVSDIVLNWTDNASNEHGYLIERSTDGGSTFKAMELAGVGPNITSYTDSNNIMTNTSYCYRVKAVNGNSDHYSNVAYGLTPNIICGSTTALNFSAGGLITTPFSIVGVPTSIPSCQTDVPITVTVVGDFDNTWEIADILGEDGTTVLGTTGVATVCDNTGATTAFTISASQYNSWAADGTITLYIGPDPDIGDICFSNTVEGCADLCVPAPACPPKYTGANQLTGIQSVVADFETDGVLESDQTINANVDYDSGTEINLLAGFEVLIGKVFNAFIDGCGNLFRTEDSEEK